MSGATCLEAPPPAAPLTDEARLRLAATRWEARGPQELLAWAAATYGDRFAVLTSFQAEGMVVVDLARQADPGVRVLTIDTGRLPQETYDVIEAVRARMGVTVETLAPDPASVAALVGRHGPNLFRRDQALRRLCCHVRKVEPLARALTGLDAYATGLRRGSGGARAATPMLEMAGEPDQRVLKLNPLASWSHERVWDYVNEHDLPVHPLYEQGYTSIGCAPCTRATLPGEPERAGRWWWEAGSDRECGLHHSSPNQRFDTALQQLRRDVSSPREDASA